MADDLWRRRTAHIREAVLKPLGLQMLLVYSDDPLNATAVRYLTDFDVYSMYALVIVPACGDVALAFGLHHSAYLVRVKDVAKADYFKGTYAPGSLCQQLLSEGLSGGERRIGIVGGNRMMQRIYADLRKYLKDATFVDVDTEFWDCIDACEPQSAEYLRRSALIASHSINGTVRFLGASCNPGEIAAEVGLLARRHGADVLNRELIQIAMAVGSPISDRLALPQHCKIGDVNAIAIEVVPSYRGFRSMCARTFVTTSQADSETIALVQAAHKAHAGICDLVQPGETIDSIVREARAIGGWNEAEKGLILFDMTRGLELSNRGGSGSVVPVELKPGMAVAVRTRLSAGHLGTVHCGDTILVKQSAAEVLTGK